MEERKMHSPREGEFVSRSGEVKQKRAYVAELMRSRGIGAVPVLAELLSNESWTLRDSAVEALLGLGRSVVPTVLPLASSGLWFSRAAAARILGAVGGSESVGPIVPMLLEGNRTVKTAAAMALSMMCRRGGSACVARRLFELDPERREPMLAELELAEPGLAERLRRLMSDQQLMALREDDESWEEGDASQRPAQGLDWEVLIGRKPQPGPR